MKKQPKEKIDTVRKKKNMESSVKFISRIVCLLNCSLLSNSYYLEEDKPIPINMPGMIDFEEKRMRANINWEKLKKKVNQNLLENLDFK